MRRAAVLDCPSLDHSCSCAQRVFPKLRTQVWLSPEEVVDDGFYLRVRLEDHALVPEAMQGALLARHVIDRQDCSQHREKIGVRNGVPAIQIPPTCSKLYSAHRLRSCAPKPARTAQQRTRETELRMS